jgi:signal transduction histidine kinase
MLLDQGTLLPDDGPRWAAVEATARQALGELRNFLGVLRHDDEVPVLTPQPGLDQLERLVDDVRVAGLPVEIRVEGDRVPLPSAVDLSAYRIVQEALTNVLKHEGRVSTTVLIRYGPDRLDVEVADRCSVVAETPSATGRGHGLIGMRERVAMFGGQFDAGHRSDGTFVVAARMPFGELST